MKQTVDEFISSLSENGVDPEKVCARIKENSPMKVDENVTDYAIRLSDDLIKETSKNIISVLNEKDMEYDTEAFNGYLEILRKNTQDIIIRKVEMAPGLFRQ